MQAVILAAGKGTRMKDLTVEIPKPMLMVSGKTLLEHKFDVLPPEVTEIIIVIGYLGHAIQERFGDSYNGKRITYVTQETLDGTAGALWRVKDLITGRFLVMMGDDIYSAQDVHACIASNDWVLVVGHIAEGRSGGKIVTDESGAISAIQEGVHLDARVTSTNLFMLDARVFSQPLVAAGNGKQEYGLPQTVLAASKALGVSLMPLQTSKWIQVTSPEDIEAAEQGLRAVR